MTTTDQVLHGVDLTGRTVLGKAKVALDGRGVELVELDLADLADLESVRRCAGEVLPLAPVLHVLINNAALAITRAAPTRSGRTRR